MNINIKQAKKKFEILLVAIIVFHIFGLIILNLFFKQFSSDFNPNLVRNILTIILAILFIAIDIFFYRKFIYRLSTLLYTEPQKCIIEDFILYPYGYDNNNSGTRTIDYMISPLVRDTSSNELYFTYGEYCMSYYTSISTHLNKTLIQKTIFRKDGSEVKIGDTAFIYIKNKLNIDVNLDEDNNIVQLNNKKFSFLHANKNYDINTFNKVVFFEGVVEVENILE